MEPNAITQTIEVGGKTLHLETGRLAKQASGAVVIRLGDTMVLTTAVVEDSAKEGQHFFPLTVDYRERFAAGGRFPGGFIKREGRPTDKEVISSRLIDRTIRPLFPEGFRNETQIIAQTISAQPEIDGDVLGGIGAAAALHLSGAPFDGPTAHVRVGRVDGEFVLFPTKEERNQGDLDIVAAGKHDALVMVEGEMSEISEDDMVDALEVAHDAIRTICDGLDALRDAYQKERGEITPMAYETVTADESIVEVIENDVRDEVNDLLRSDEYSKDRFYSGMDDIRDRMIESRLGDAEETDEGWTKDDLKSAFKQAQSRIMRTMILEEGLRLDGRKKDEVRDIWTQTTYLPRVHGSAVFTRGETQALVKVTLGTGRDSQETDQLFDQEERKFYLHYNFPPFSVGEARFLRGPSRREVGHGHLAERALKKLMPSSDSFPYVVRVVSDVLESNGSSSMASVCGGSMALMDAGVPLKKPVAGIAMGLIDGGNGNVAILSDILGTEDHLGDMDFKVTGTEDGITACQMDIKVDGLEMSTLRDALKQARSGRLHILKEMAKTISEARSELAPTAPRLIQILVDQEHIGGIIGPGGKVIRSIQEDTGTQVNIEEEDGKGIVTIAAPDMEAAQAAVEIIKGIVATPEVGETYEGTVKKILPFGAIMEILPGKEAMLHISEIRHDYVEKVEDEMQVGDKLKVQLIEVRNDGKLRLSRKPFIPQPSENGKDDD